MAPPGDIPAGIPADIAADIADAVAIGRLNTAYAQARILQCAVELGLFDLLAREPATAGEVCDRLSLHPRLTRPFLDALVALGLLVNEDGAYRDSTRAARLLVQGGPYYLGDLCATAAQRHYPTWERLTEALRDGKPKAAKVGGPDAFARLYANPEAARRFLGNMDSAHAVVGPQLAEVVDWARYTSFVDVGGARGNLAAQLVHAHPHLRGGVFELPPVEPMFDEHMARLCATGRVRFHGGDFFTDPLPEADVLIFGHVLHDWPAERRQELLRRAYPSVRPGGAVVIYDQMLDPDAPDLHGLIGSLNVALITEGAEYTAAECQKWVTEAGFRVTGVRGIETIGGDTVLVAARDA